MKVRLPSEAFNREDDGFLADIAVKERIVLGWPRDALRTAWIVEMRVRVDDTVLSTGSGRLASRECPGGECGAGNDELPAAEWQ
jgi:hypothetical protein